MKEKLKFIFLTMLSFVIFFEGGKWGLWLMNQPVTFVFYLGLLLTLGCVFGFYLVTYQQLKQLIKQIKNKK
jgi:multidrug efflux pump subunit AcrB